MTGRRMPLSLRACSAVAAVALLVLIAAGCGSDDDGGNENQAASGGEQQELEKITISLIPTPVSAAFFIGMDRGYFEDEGVELEPVTIQTGSGTVPALLTNRLDIAMGGPSAGLYRTIADNPGKIKIIGTAAMAQTWGDVTSGNGVYVRTDLQESGEITEPADLKGRSVAMLSEGHQIEYYFGTWLRQNGLEFGEDVKPTIIGASADIDAAVRSKRVELATGLSPFGQNWIEEGIAEPLFITDDLLPNANLLVAMAGEKFLAERPEAAAALLRAVRKGQADYREAFDAGPDSAAYKEVVDIIAKHLEVDAATVQLASGLVVCENTEDLENMAEFFVSRGYLDEAPPLEDYVDSSPLEASAIDGMDNC